MARYITENNVRREMTADEETAFVNEQNSMRVPHKIQEVRRIRNELLKETDLYALQDVTMSNEMKTWRQSLRDIPANHTDEAAYDLLLARDENGNLTHSVWSKP